MRYITAEYNIYGYTIMVFEQRRPDKPAKSIYGYSAGNHRTDSCAILPRGSLYALPLRSIRSMCIKTAKEVADGYNAEFTGVERIPDELDN